MGESHLFALFHDFEVEQEATRLKRLSPGPTLHTGTKGCLPTVTQEETSKGNVYRMKVGRGGARDLSIPKLETRDFNSGPCTVTLSQKGGRVM